MANLLQSLVNRYKTRGWSVRSDIADGCDNIPDSWKGPKPDILILHKKEAVAVCIETINTLRDEKKVNKWKEIKNNNVKLTIVVKDNNTFQLAKSVAQSNNIEINIRVVKRTLRKMSPAKINNRFGKGSRFDWLIIVVVAITLLLFIILYTPNLLSYFKLKSFYQPHDKERQEEFITKQKEELKGKSKNNLKNELRKDKEKFKKYQELMKKKK